MPILEAYNAETVIVNKRSMASGCAGLDNELFYMDKTMMVFGDAKKVVEQMVKPVERRASTVLGRQARAGARSAFQSFEGARAAASVRHTAPSPSRMKIA
jgi:hypothetical protein